MALQLIDETDLGSTTRANTDREEVPRELVVAAGAEKVRHAAVSDWEKTWTMVSDSIALPKFNLPSVYRHPTSIVVTHSTTAR